MGYDRPIQAADLFLRQKLDLRELDAVHLERVEPKGNQRHVILRVNTDQYEL